MPISFPHTTTRALLTVFACYTSGEIPLSGDEFFFFFFLLLFKIILTWTWLSGVDCGGIFPAGEKKRKDLYFFCTEGYSICLCIACHLITLWCYEYICWYSSPCLSPKHMQTYVSCISPPWKDWQSRQYILLDRANNACFFITSYLFCLYDLDKWDKWSL